MKNLTPGLRVVVPSLGIVGDIKSVEPECLDGEPCKCCGYGVVIKPLGNPNASYGVAPADCLPVTGAAMLVKGGSA